MSPQAQAMFESRRPIFFAIRPTVLFPVKTTRGGRIQTENAARVSPVKFSRRGPLSKSPQQHYIQHASARFRQIALPTLPAVLRTNKVLRGLSPCAVWSGVTSSIQHGTRHK